MTRGASVRAVAVCAGLFSVFGVASLLAAPEPPANAIGPSPVHQHDEGQPAEELLRDLQRLFKPMNAPVLADVEGVWVSMGAWNLPEPVTAGSLQALASYIDRGATAVNGAWVFHRTGDLTAKLPERLKVARWLLGDRGDRSAIINGSASLYGLSAGGQEVLRRLSCNAGGLGGLMMSGQKVHVKLCYSFSVRVKDPQTGFEREIVAPEDGADAAPATVGDNVNRDLTPAIAAVSDGLYDAGEGKLLPMEDLLKEAGKAFGKTYFVDGRFASDRVFIRGRFTPDRFIAALRRMTIAEPSVAIEGDSSSRKEELNSALEQLWDELADADLSGSAAAELKRKLKNGVVNMTAGEMSRISQIVASTCKLWGIAPESNVSVHRDMILYVYGDGTFELPHGGTTYNIEPFGLAPQR